MNPLRPVCFMVMPFGKKPVPTPPPGAPALPADAPAMIDFDALWNKVLAPLITELGYDPVRADQDTGASILVEMLHRLYFSDLVVADMTIPNGNVYYEIGVRHACRETGCLLISASWAPVLFDTNQLRRLTYPLTDGAIGDDAATAIQAALRNGALALAQGMSPMYQTIPGFPDQAKADPNHANVIRAQLEAMSAFQARVRAARITRDHAEAAALARKLRDDYPATAEASQSTYLELATLLRDVVGWQDCIDYIDALPENVRTLDVLKEQRSLALSKTGDHLQAIGALEELVRTRGDSSERQGLIGGRYKKLAAAAEKAGDSAKARQYIDLAIKHYDAGMRLDLNDYYPTCNLPRLYKQRNRRGDAERAAAATQVALIACERARARRSPDEWLNPTLLGLAFDAGDVQAAQGCVDAVRDEGHAAWKLETTLADLRRSVEQTADPTTKAELGALADELQTLLPT